MKNRDIAEMIFNTLSDGYDNEEEGRRRSQSLPQNLTSWKKAQRSKLH
ncbi:hypothetical protein ACQRAF_07590 [Lachnospiraceae bacterium SGI.240]